MIKESETNREVLTETSETCETAAEVNEESTEAGEIENLKSELESTKNKLLRVAAEYDNYRKRTEKEKSLIYTDATSFAVLNIIPVIDSLELAFSSIEPEGEECRKGVDMVRKQLSSALEKLGVTSFGEKGEAFDPNLHSAVSKAENEGEEDKQIISEVFQKGYKMDGKIIRHANVQVSS
jgi:molecular chaperone GrpE